MSRSGEKKGDGGVNLVLSVDHDGVVRVVNCEAEQFLVTPGELARMLTGILSTILSTHQDQNETININLN